MKGELLNWDKYSRHFVIIRKNALIFAPENDERDD